jgi:hypothetical protein
MPTGDQMRRPPAHAGRLPPWERFAIALVLLAIAALIIVIVMSAEPPQHSAGPNAAHQHTPAVAGTSPGSASPATVTGLLPAPSVWENQQLATALSPALRGRGGSIAVGVVDGRTGAIYGGDRVFHTGGIVSADILAVLLLQHQQAGTTMSVQQRELAAKMIENGDDDAAAALWNAIGRATGLAAANRVLHLDHTVPGDSAQLTSTTVGDQLLLLTELTSPGSPLPAASRSYELGLMRHVAAGQQWGITAAAAPGSSPAVFDGSLPAGAASPGGRPPGSGTTWVTNSIGVIFRSRHQILVAVLSDHQPSESAGMDQVEAAVRSAVSAITDGHAP